MTDPLLSSLCRICNTNPSRYRCPGCASQTCSVACIKRHKVWTSCNGTRDPTVYKPREELLTASGVDHDFNFISAIERGIERSDKLLVEERGLIDYKELQGPKNTLAEKRRGRRTKIIGDALSHALGRSGVTVNRAPKGMSRGVENGTAWYKAQKCILWQVEWIQEDGVRLLSRTLESKPVGQAYVSLLEDRRRSKMTESERREEKLMLRAAKKAALNGGKDPSTQSSTQQRAVSSLNHLIVDRDDKKSDETAVVLPSCALSSQPTVRSTIASYPSTTDETTPGYYFYLHKPHTPSSRPRVLIPLHAADALGPQLRNRVVLEFPTIHVLKCSPIDLPDTFMLEKESRGGRNLGVSISQEEMAVDMDIEEGELV